MRGLCSKSDITLPRLYVLGQQKSGTTAISTILFQAGALPAVQYSRARDIQGHGTDIVKSYTRNLWGTDANLLLKGAVKESNLLRGVKKPACWSSSCLSAAQKKWEERLSFFRNCSSWDTTVLADMSIDNLHKPERASLLQYFYGPLSQHLIFIIILRKPIDRFRSGFYWNHPPNYYGHPRGERHAHNRTLHSEIEFLSSVLPPTFELVQNSWTELQSVSLDAFTRSMYFLNFRPWLDQFQSRQFAVFPMKFALANVSRATSIVSRHFHVPLVEKPHIFNSNKTVKHKLNPNRYQAVEDANTSRGLEWLDSTYFAPDTRRLAHLFSTSMSNGMMLAGATSSSEDDILMFLKNNW